MSILITGGAGYIGSHLTMLLRERGYNPVVLDNLETGFKDAVPGGVPFVRGGFGDELLIKEVCKEYSVESVVHFAAYSIAPESKIDPLKYYKNNTGSCISMLGALVDAGVRRFVLSSSAAVYGEQDADLVVETSPLRPINPYGSSKLMTEQILKDLGESGKMDYIALRYFNVAGAHPLTQNGSRALNATHLIKVALEVAMGKRPQLNVFGNDFDTVDGTGVRDYIHVWDLAEAHLLALQRLSRHSDSAIYNCGYGRGFSVLEVIDAVERITGSKVKYQIVDRRAGDPAKVVASTRKIREELNWDPVYNDLDTIVRHMLQWEKRNFQ